MSPAAGNTRVDASKTQRWERRICPTPPERDPKGELPFGLPLQAAWARGQGHSSRAWAQPLDVSSSPRSTPGRQVGRCSSPPRNTPGAACLLHHLFLITLHKERPLLARTPWHSQPGGWLDDQVLSRFSGSPSPLPLAQKLLLVSPHQPCGPQCPHFAETYVHAPLSLPSSVLELCQLSLAESHCGLLQHQAERRQGKRHRLIFVLTPI